VKAGRPVRVSLDERVTIARAGQPITGTVVEDVYAYDRVVIPAGTKALGHVARIDGPSKAKRAQAWLRGDFSPPRHPVLEFDTVVLNDQQVAMQTVVTGAVANVARMVAGGDKEPRGGAAAGRVRAEVAQARNAVAQQTKDAIAMIRRPGRMARVRDALIQRLPYHPQYLAKGTVFNAELVTPLGFGAVTPITASTATAATPWSVLTARLVTPLDSAKTPRGAPVVAVLTVPIFSADQQLVLPEGTELRGTVTFAKPVAHFHRNGRLRMLFESIQRPDAAPARQLASLHSVQASADEHLALDEEGGTTIENSNTRFIAFAIALLALNAATEGAEAGEAGIGRAAGTSVEGGHVVGRGLGGFVGFGVLGIGVSQISRPIAIGIGAIGAAQSIYASVFGKGKEVAFPADTAIQVQLAPGPLKDD
jgi:hypothetical protein